MKPFMKKSDWWKSSVFYQIYPRSFQDTNRDGIGDLEGIIQRLDYVQWLGVDAIWLSPVFQSPQKDFGYDIANYYQIDSTFGDMATIERLILEAHQHNIKVIMDGVFNHTSDQHPWFIESQTGKTDKSDWYIWRDQPNNWTSAFGGSAWTFCSQRQAYYLHTFASSQPDLNWSNPAVREAILAVQRFWYEKGVDGFRLDVFNAFCKDDRYRNNPRRWDVVGLLGGLFYGYIGQEHVYDRDRPELVGVLQSFRQLANDYDAVLIGETLDERFQYQKAKDYMGEDRLHLAFNFSPLHANLSNLPKVLADVSQEVEYPAWVWSNHDFPRQSKRWGNHPNRGKLMAVIQFLAKGVPFIYYGEEIDQPQVSLRRREVVDPPGKKFYPFYKGRDGSRTPMNWGGTGFCEQDIRTWLPIKGTSTVEQQQRDPTSMLNLYRRLISLRKSESVFQTGSIKWHPDGFMRSYQGERWFVALNWTCHPIACPDIVQGVEVVEGTIFDEHTIEPFGFGVWKLS